MTAFLNITKGIAMNSGNMSSVRVLSASELEMVAGGFSFGGFAKAVGQGIVAGVAGGTASDGVKGRISGKPTGRAAALGAAGGAVAGGIVGGVNYFLHH